MRHELNEICLIDRYLLRQLDETERRVFEASLLLDGPLAEKVDAQRMTLRLIRLYGRLQQRSLFDGIYAQLLGEASFARRLKNIFS